MVFLYIQKAFSNVPHPKALKYLNIVGMSLDGYRIFKEASKITNRS